MGQLLVSLVHDLHIVSFHWCLNFSSIVDTEMVIGHPYILFSAFHLTAGSDYTPGPNTVNFSAGLTSAILMGSTFIDDNTTEMSEYFAVMISSVDKPDVVEIATPSTSVVTIVDNNPGIAYITL